MSYDDRPWLKSYDPGVPHDIVVPDASLVEQFEEIAGRNADGPALSFFGRILTYGELARSANIFANGLLANGCKPGDIVGINLPNIPQYVIAQIGAMKAGCAACGLSPLLTPKETLYQLNDCRARALVTLDAIFERRFLSVADQAADVKLVVATGVLDFLPWIKRVLGRYLKKAPHGKVTPIPDKTVIRFAEMLNGYPASAPDVIVTPDHYCLIQYTGGTTGVPKGAILTHRNISANLRQIRSWIGLDQEGYVFLSGFPLFHLAGLALCLVALMMKGSQILIPDPRDTKSIVKEMARLRPTVMVNVPSFYMKLMEDPGFRKLDHSRLSFLLSGASPFPLESIRELESIVGEGKVMEVYGMTETSPIITMNPRHNRKKPGSVGLPVPSTRVRIMDLETGTRQAPMGEAGELQAAGPQVMKGYHNKPRETELTLVERDGAVWMRTGDVARMDEDGFVTIVDRAKDMLNVGGFKVFSREVEEKIYQLPFMEFCAIVGIPNPKRPGTDIVKLVVQTKAAFRNRDPEELRQEILSFARENLAPYKVPRIVEFIDAMPLTVVGKVDKKKLR